jgi:hypothetical protein
LALTSPTGGGRSVGVVRSRTKATEFSLVFLVPSLTSSECWRKGEAFGSEEHEVMGGGLLLKGNRQAVCFLILLLRRMYCGGIEVIIFGWRGCGGILMLMLEGLHKKHLVRRTVWFLDIYCRI